MGDGPLAESETVAAIVADLNDAQRRAVTAGDEPLLIIAGAGTGKTTALAHRVAYLIATGTDPGRILLLTFTRRASAEMLRRVDALLARFEGGRAEVWGGTFHAVAARLLRLHGKAIGLEPSFTILDRSDSEDLMNVVRTELGLSTGDRRFPQKSTCLDIYSRCIDSREKLPAVLAESFPWCEDSAEGLRRLFEGYVEAKERQRILDYDDLLLFWHALLADERAGARIRERFDRVLVDEYQDTNVLQAGIVRLLRPDGTGVTVVGDDAQSIYSFRAATVRNILDFQSTLPDVRVETLEQNYRSTRPILHATNRVIGLAAERHAKELWSERDHGRRPLLVTCLDEEEQTLFIVERILEHREEGIELKRQAVLFRASHHSLDLELELTRRNIPFVKYGGLKFTETTHVKDLMAFLRLGENPRDLVAGSRVLLLLPGIGPTRARRLMDMLGGSGQTAAAEAKRPAKGAADAYAHGPASHPRVFDAWRAFAPPAATGHLWESFVAVMDRLAAAGQKELPAQVQAVRLFLEPLIRERYSDARARLGDLEQLEHLSSRFGDRTRFLSELTIDPPAWTGDFAGPPLLDEDYLILSTMHSAKGLEWDAVYVIHAADGNMPSDMATGRPEEIEEERRLFYVALTRAKDFLYVCFPLRYYKNPPSRETDVHGYAQVTRFIPDAVRETFEECQAAPAGDDGAVEPGRPGRTTASVRDSLKDLWS
jgi:DNA helicase-2/ATP-dependent DNA helicase PcrA